MSRKDKKQAEQQQPTIKSAKLDWRSHSIRSWRIAKTGFRNFFRNAWLTTAATAIMVITLTVVSVGFILSLSLTETINQITEEVALEVYLLDDINDQARSSLRAQLEDDPNVRSVTYISQEEALARFQEDFADNPSILKGLSLSENRLPASYRVELYDLTKVDSTIDVTRKPEFSTVVEDINFDEKRKESIDRIASWQDFIIISSVVAGLVFAFISVLIIFNTIRMAIYTRNYEIEIMKLIGATPSYIRGPFLFEASMYGVIAGIISLVLVYSLVLTVLPNAGNFLEFEETRQLFTDYWYVVGIAIIGTGVLLGFLSAIVAMARYLRLKKW